MAEIKISINGRNIITASGKTILEAAAENGIEIPHLCYDKRIKPYGACGLCVVEIQGVQKLIRACAAYVSEGQIIMTDTPRANATRKAALKLLVSDHRGDCRPPCVLACPAHTDCQGYTGLIANGQYREAVALIKEKIPIPASIGRVCPHPCETACRRNMVEEPISIASLKSFAADQDLKGNTYIPDIKPPTGKRVAVIGAGPSGLANAYFLAIEGHRVTVFEAMPYPGGMLRYGIPEYRLPKAILDTEIKLIEDMGVDFRFNTKIGQDVALEDLRRDFDAVFLGIGAWKSSDIRCKGEDMDGVIGGIDFLREVSMKGTAPIGKKVLVVGGGNTAMDVARTAIRLGAEKVSVIYRRTRDEMPAEDMEIQEAEEEGVEFNFLVAPLEVIERNGRAAGLLCQKMRLGEPDATGRRKPEPIEGVQEIFEADTVIAAIGQRVDTANMGGLKLAKSGTIEANGGTFETNMPGVFAGGDAVTGPKIAIEAIAQGKLCAEVMNRFLNGEAMLIKDEHLVVQDDLTQYDFKDREKQQRVRVETLPPEERRHSFREVSGTMTEDEARKEAFRCLECGCRDYFECQLYKYINEYDIDTENMKGEKHKRPEENSHPFIERNADKCILCGLCVRACDEIMGVTALGLVNRGFETIVKPEFGLPLEKTDCISCGLCAAVCPTGACMEKEAVKKQVPVKLHQTKSVCGFCGVGCNLVLETRGNLIYRAVPDNSCGDGLLCHRGRFGISVINDENRIRKPQENNGNGFVSITWDDAMDELAKNLIYIRDKYGKNSIAFITSRGITNEEARKIVSIGKALKTRFIGSSDECIIDAGGSAARYEDIDKADLILSFGNVTENHPVLGIRIKNAVQCGAKLISISGKPSRERKWAEISLNPQNSMEFLRAVFKASIAMMTPKDISEKGIESIKEIVMNADATGIMKSVISLYMKAQKPVMIIDEDTVTADAYKIVRLMEKLHPGKMGGIIIARRKCNTKGTLDMGIISPWSEIINKIGDGTVKALVALGEDPASSGKDEKETFKKLEFIASFDAFMTETAKMSQLVLPFATFTESSGSFTNSDGSIKYINAAIKPLSGRENIDVLTELLKKVNLNKAGLAEGEIASASDNEPLSICEHNKTEESLYNALRNKDAPVFHNEKTCDTLELEFRKYCCK